MSRQEWESVALAAERVGVSRQAVHKQIGRRLVAWKVHARLVTVKSDDVDRWIAERQWWAERSHVEVPF